MQLNVLLDKKILVLKNFFDQICVICVRNSTIFKTCEKNTMVVNIIAIKDSMLHFVDPVNSLDEFAPIIFKKNLLFS